MGMQKVTFEILSLWRETTSEDGITSIQPISRGSLSRKIKMLPDRVIPL
jgi:hypothetical protein